MGEGFINKLPNAVDAFFIKQGLNDLFGQHLPHVRTKHSEAKQRYPGLLEHDASATGLDRRQRSLRHAAWLLTDEIFANAPDGHQPTFRYWLRWLTWIERAPPGGAQVTVVGPPVDLSPADNGVLTPAHAILDTLFRAIDRTRRVEFDWNLAPVGGP